jgi:hypothetical protein
MTELHDIPTLQDYYSNGVDGDEEAFGNYMNGEGADVAPESLLAVGKQPLV